MKWVVATAHSSIGQGSQQERNETLGTQHVFPVFGAEEADILALFDKRGDYQEEAGCQRNTGIQPGYAFEEQSEIQKDQRAVHGVADKTVYAVGYQHSRFLKSQERLIVAEVVWFPVLT